MAKVINNPLIASLSGKFGDSIVFRKMKDGRTIVAAMPDFSNRVLSQGQITHQSRFKQAVAYAVEASKTNPLYAELAAGTAKNAYNIALSDWFNPPVIHRVTRQNGCIRVHATDNVKVTKVLITITGEQGQTLEQGEAALAWDGLWEYKPASPDAGSIVIEVFDLAGNITRHEP